MKKRLRDMTWEDYGISKNRYKELKAFCLQYDEKKSKIKYGLSATQYDGQPKGHSVGSQVENQAIDNDIYKRDYSCSGSSCSEKGSTYTSYLLKTVTAAEPEDPCEDYTYKVGHKSECCPSASQSDSVCYTSCPASYKWQPYKDYTFGVYDGYEYIIGTSALSQSWFGAADWVEKACRQGEFYRTTQGPITCNSAVTSTWCWNPLALNPNFKVVFRAAEHSVNIGQPDTFLGTCSSVGARALLLWGSTYTGYFAEETVYRIFDFFLFSLQKPLRVQKIAERFVGRSPYSAAQLI